MNLMQGRLIFRTEANTTIGRGHLSRCIAIADMLKNEIAILFVILKSNEEFIANILNNYAFKSINNEEDLVELLQKEDLLWIDGYSFNEDWKKQMRPLVKRLIETNDIPYIPKNVDILFNQTPGLKKNQFIDDNASVTKLYLGLDYALLRQKFLNNAKTSVPKLNDSGAFICFGGADPYNLGEKFVCALLENGFSDPIYWVSNNTEIHRTAYNNKNMFILSDLNEVEMIETMSQAKVMLIPSSVLSFEAIALRKPIFTCYFVDNQKLIHQGLFRNGLARCVGYLETRKDVENAVVDFLEYYNKTEIQLQQIIKQTKILDGKSDSRIKKIILDKLSTIYTCIENKY